MLVGGQSYLQCYSYKFRCVFVSFHILDRKMLVQHKQLAKRTNVKLLYMLIDANWRARRKAALNTVNREKRLIHSFLLQLRQEKKQPVNKILFNRLNFDTFWTVLYRSNQKEFVFFLRARLLYSTRVQRAAISQRYLYKNINFDILNSAKGVQYSFSFIVYLLYEVLLIN